MNDLELNDNDIELLIHFATIGQSHVIVRDNHGDREVAKELDPVLIKAHRLLNKKVGLG